MNNELILYIQKNIMPRYQYNDKAHRADHILRVIRNSLLIAQDYDVDLNIIYTAAAYHDLGLAVERERHEVFSKEIMLSDKRLDDFFNEKEKETIADAIVSHRASSKGEPKTIYGKIVADADRDLVPARIIERTVLFSLANFPSRDKEGHFIRTYEHIKEKYGEGGYLTLWLDTQVNNDNLAKLRNLISDKSRFRKVFHYYYNQTHTAAL